MTTFNVRKRYSNQCTTYLKKYEQPEDCVIETGKPEDYT